MVKVSQHFYPHIWNGQSGEQATKATRWPCGRGKNGSGQLLPFSSFFLLPCYAVSQSVTADRIAAWIVVLHAQSSQKWLGHLPVLNVLQLNLLQRRAECCKAQAPHAALLTSQVVRSNKVSLLVTPIPVPSLSFHKGISINISLAYSVSPLGKHLADCEGRARGAVLFEWMFHTRSLKKIKRPFSSSHGILKIFHSLPVGR